MYRATMAPVQEVGIPAPRRTIWLIGSLIPAVLFALGADSRLLLEQGYDLQVLSNLTAPLYLLIIMRALKPDQRIMVLVFVPFSALGEYIFSLVFQLYTYKFIAVPIYVPFGHAILLSVGLLIEDSPWVVARLPQVRWGLIAFLAALFGGAAIALGDTFSLIMGVLYVWILQRKRARLLYLIMGVLVLYIELAGTALGCWVWDPQPFGVLSTTNPPVGAFVCYVIADILVLKIAARLQRFIRRTGEEARNIPLEG